MDGRMGNSNLLEMPPLIIEKILSNVLNLTNVQLTCKALYDTVCHMEKRRRVIRIKHVATTDNSARLTIDDDVVFDSIMNSHRTITNIQVDVYAYSSPYYVILNERQLERLTAIMEHFGAKITSLKLSGIGVLTDKIIELLRQTPKLESLEFVNGMAFGDATKSSHLSSLKKLSISRYHGLLEIIHLLPDGSLNEFCCSFERERYHQSEVVETILSKQPNIKSLEIDGCFDLVVLRVNHLSLEKLELGRDVCYDSNQLMEMLMFHTNLKEFRLWIHGKHLQPKTVEWISDNLNELEVLHVPVDSKQNFLPMLGKLKKLRYFSTNVMDFLTNDKLKFDSLAKLELRYGSCCEHYNQFVRFMVQTFTNLTDLEMPVGDFSALSFLLSQCPTLIHLTSFIKNPSPLQLAEKCFPKIRHLTITFRQDNRDNSQGMSIITSIVRAMPNLQSLWMPSNEIMFNVNAVKEFILVSKSLDELKVDFFKLDHDLSDFVETIRPLSDRLKAYGLGFRSNRLLFTNAIKDILFNEFNVRGCYESFNDVYFVLRKGVLTKFRGYP